MRACSTARYAPNPVCSRGVRRFASQLLRDQCADYHHEHLPFYINEERPFETIIAQRPHRIITRTTCKNGHLYSVTYLEHEGYPRP